MAKKQLTDLEIVRNKLRQAADDSQMTQQQIGEKMGFGKDDARKAVSRLLNVNISYDPRLSSVLKFAKAIGKELKDLL